MIGGAYTNSWSHPSQTTHYSGWEFTGFKCAEEHFMKKSYRVELYDKCGHLWDEMQVEMLVPYIYVPIERHLGWAEWNDPHLERSKRFSSRRFKLTEVVGRGDHTLLHAYNTLNWIVAYYCEE